MNALLKYCRPTVTALALAMAAGLAHADERESLEALRQTTLSLIEALVQGGVITRDKADQLLADARQRAQQVSAQNAGHAAPVVAASSTNPAGKPVQRVPYVSEALRVQLRNEVKEEILAQARQERWGVPNAPSWIDRIRIDGDIRYRYQADRPDSGNTAPVVYFDAEANDVGRTSRAPDFAAYAQNGTIPYPSASTQDGRNRERIRLRLGLTAKVTDEVGVGVRLATGSATDRVSTNQTLGQNFNKYQLFVDRAFVRVDPADWLTVQAGRIPNPWFATDMVWSENLNFEGVAATTRWTREEGQVAPFATVGWFPLREQSAGIRGARSLMGAQVGASMDLSARTRLKMGLAWYRYQNLEGREDLGYEQVDANEALVNPVTYGRHEYPISLRQKGNTVFETNPAFDQFLPPVWGLAYQFRPLVLTASAEFTHFAPFSLLVSAEYVRNTAFSASDFRARAGASFAGVDPGGKDTGYHLKAAFGAAEVREQGQWQVAASYRHVGSDAVLDAFTDSDLGLGGTNLEGYTLGLTYGLYRNTSVGVRYLSARSIDSTINAGVPDARYNVNSLQVDFNVRF